MPITETFFDNAMKETRMAQGFKNIKINFIGSAPGGVIGCLIFLIALVIALIFVAATFAPSLARDLGQWEASDPAIREWYRDLKQPDNPASSCCGESDAYWADEVHVRDGKTYATITDDRDDAPLGRPHIESGTVIEIPDHKLKWDRGNPTGHGVVFLSRQGFVFCYVQPGGA